MNRTTSLRALAAVSGIALGVWVIVGLANQAPRTAPVATVPTPTAPADLKAFVQKNAQKKDPVVQDQVGQARMRLAYHAAKQGDFKAARVAFQETTKEYKGSGGMRADYGGVPDQAAYQAAVCLVADGKPKEAEKEFVRFIKDRPLSPLVHAVYGRLKRLNDGDSTRAWDELLQSAVTKQEAYIRFETSVCGPKAIERMLPLLGKPAKGYKELAKLCGTTDEGTTLEGMRKGLLACGVDAYGVEVNRADIASLAAPFLLLEGDHYVLVTKVEPLRLTVYDPRFKSEARRDLPPLDKTDFSVTVLTTTLPRSLVSAN